MDKLEDKQLIGEMAMGNERALNAFRERYEGVLYSILLSFSKDPVMAEKWLDAVFAQIRMHAAHYDTANESVPQWVWSIADRFINRKLKTHQPTAVSYRSQKTPMQAENAETG